VLVVAVPWARPEAAYAARFRAPAASALAVHPADAALAMAPSALARAQFPPCSL